MNKMMMNFLSPGPEFRGAPFWAWNAKLEPGELRRQIRIFKRMGLGGFFMHSRVGLGTPYLSKEWFDCIKACADEARKQGLKAHLYDEDRWPSGAAGSLVTRDDRYKARRCCAEFYARRADAVKVTEGRTLAWFSVRLGKTPKGGSLQVTKPRRLGSPDEFKCAPGRRLLRFAVRLNAKSSWFNGETYLDTLNPEAVKKFVEVTHEAYFRETGKDFGELLPSIFTDEPNFNHFGPRNTLPWTDELPEIFRKTYGKDILDLLPEIFFVSVRRLSPARRLYYDLLTALFCRAFSKTVGEWCGKHHIAMTGHALGEDLLDQSLYVGAAMRFYEYMQMPGIDLLTEHWRIFNTAKQCVSMARQFGRQWRLSETYGCTGWDFPFSGHKALGDWQYALGINFRCQHLAWYSAEAQAKRDYPASISYQSPWWEKYAVVEDYFARLGAILSEGEEIRDILVIHPIESAWMEMDPAAPWGSLAGAEKRFAAVTETLLAEKLDFDFGDEEILSRYGKVKGKTIFVNKASYKAVLVPRLLTIRKSTIDLLAKFAEAGGEVIYLDRPPRFLDGVPSPGIAPVFAKFARASLAGAVKLLGECRRVSVTAPSGRQIGPVLARLAENTEGFSLFLCNYGANFNATFVKNDVMVRERRLTFPRAHVVLRLPRRGDVWELDPRRGSARKIPYTFRNGRYSFDTSFGELESRLYIITEKAPGLPETPPAPVTAGKSSTLPAEKWKCTLSEPNVLVLDHPAWRLGKEARREEMFILHLDREIRRILGKPPRGGAMVQPWLRSGAPRDRETGLELVYTIRVDEVPKSDCKLAVEHPEFYSFELNGRKLAGKASGSWFDRSLACLPVPASMLKKGENRLVLRTKYRADQPGLESLFLLGDFGVRSDTLTRAPRTLDIGDWCAQGLPYYAGNVTLAREVEVPAPGATVSFPAWRGVLLGVRVDNGPEKLLPWAPYGVELPAGKHTLAVTVYGHRRNAMGPFYCATPWPPWTGADQFTASQSAKRQLVPCGLLEPPVLRKIKEGTKKCR